MKYSTKELKALCRQSLIGQYGIIILCYILVSLIMGAIMSPFQNQLESYGNRLMTDPEWVDLSTVSIPWVPIIALILIALASTILMAGLSRLQLAIARYEKLSVTLIFSQFKNRPDRFIVYTILILLIEVGCVAPGGCFIGYGVYSLQNQSDLALGILLGGILLIIVGAIFSIFLALRFSMTIYVLVDDSDASVVEAMKDSYHMLKGNTGKLLYTILSFIPMGLLVTLSFGIASLWIQPYVETTLCWFYLDVSGELREKEEKARRLEEEMGPMLDDISC